MFAIFIALVVCVVLFALCKTQEQTLDAQRDFWIKAFPLLDQLDHCK